MAARNACRDVANGAAPFVDFVGRWQFLLLNPETMGQPRARVRTGGMRRMAGDGSNVAEYLLELLQSHPAAFDEVVEAMSFVLPDSSEVQARMTGEIDLRVYLELVEQAGARNYRVPGWLFSTGTLRVLAIVALLKDPEPPPVIFIEEVENGLDPRTVGLVVDLLHEATSAGRTQVIATSHSPYLLDLLALDDLVLCTRSADRGPVFVRPGTDLSLREWVQDFSPGQLCTMGRLQRASAPNAAPAGSEPEAPEGGWTNPDQA